jgi:transposase
LPPSSPPLTAGAWSRCSTGAAAARATCRSPAEREAIEVVALDSYDAYRQAVKTALPGARIGCDPFHLVCGANTALDTGRRERQREAPRFAWLRR